MIKERGLRWWPWRSSQDEEHGEDKKLKIIEILDSVTFLRAQALAHIEALRAQVNGEDMWFTCYHEKRDNPGEGEQSK